MKNYLMKKGFLFVFTLVLFGTLQAQKIEVTEYLPQQKITHIKRTPNHNSMEITMRSGPSPFLVLDFDTKKVLKIYLKGSMHSGRSGGYGYYKGRKIIKPITLFGMHIGRKVERTKQSKLNYKKFKAMQKKERKSIKKLIRLTKN